MRRRGTWASDEVAVQYLAHQVSGNVAEVIEGGASPRAVGHCSVTLAGCCGGVGVRPRLRSNAGCFLSDGHARRRAAA